MNERMFQERTMIKDPDLGKEYKLYKIRVPYRIIPYIW
jgi:protein-S-isoprenylcysteine O-methyltransferase Ste14